MHKRYIVLLLSVLSVAVSGCRTALPTGDTSTQAGTLQLIQDMMNASGKVEFVNHMNGRTADVTFEVSRAKAYVEPCSIGYHARSTIEGMVLFDRDGKIHFGQVESLQLLTAEDYLKMSAPAAEPMVTPPTWAVLVQADEAGRRAGQGDTFIFTDKAWADAFKNAVSKARTFCAVKK